MPSPTSPATKVHLKDVARHAGVSAATVSAVVRGDRSGTVRVGDQTRERVLAAVKELGYRPNKAARTLRTQRTCLIGLVVPDLTNPLFPRLARSVQVQAERSGFGTLIYDSGLDPHRERTSVESFIDHQVEGVVLVTEHLGEADVSTLLAAGIRVAATDSRLHSLDVDLVSEDLREGARLATRHLIECGHERIAHLAGDLRTSAGRERLVGFETAMAEHGLTPVPPAGGSSFTREAGEEATVELLNSSVPPTAIFAANDVLAISAIQVCRARDLLVPDQVAVIGVDDIPEGRTLTPALSTVDVRPDEVADQLATVLIGRLQGAGDEPIRRTVTPRLVTRSST